MADAAEPAGGPWTVVFGRSRAVPLMYPVRQAHRATVVGIVDGLGLESWGTGVRLYEGSCSAYPLLDGAVCSLTAYGMAPMPSGVRVLGARPLRLLCHLMDLRGPARKLPGEVQIPTAAELMSDLARQFERDRQALAVQAMAALFQDSDGARAAVSALFGVRAAPSPEI